MSVKRESINVRGLNEDPLRNGKLTHSNAWLKAGWAVTNRRFIPVSSTPLNAGAQSTRETYPLCSAEMLQEDGGWLENAKTKRAWRKKTHINGNAKCENAIEWKGSNGLVMLDPLHRINYFSPKRTPTTNKHELHTEIRKFILLTLELSVVRVAEREKFVMLKVIRHVYSEFGG